jgi:hypothetical protein
MLVLLVDFVLGLTVRRWTKHAFWSIAACVTVPIGQRHEHRFMS